MKRLWLRRTLQALSLLIAIGGAGILIWWKSTAEQREAMHPDKPHEQEELIRFAVETGMWVEAQDKDGKLFYFAGSSKYMMPLSREEVIEMAGFRAWDYLQAEKRGELVTYDGPDRKYAEMIVFGPPEKYDPSDSKLFPTHDRYAKELETKKSPTPKLLAPSSKMGIIIEANIIDDLNGKNEKAPKGQEPLPSLGDSESDEDF